MKSMARCMEETGIGIDQLVKATGLDKKRVEAIACGNFTPSPAQRKLLAEALGVSMGDIHWGHAVTVQHLRGNGTQLGRNT